MARLVDTAAAPKSTDAEYEALVEQIAALKADIAGLSGAVSDLTRAESEAAVARVKSEASALKAKGDAQVEEIRRQVTEATLRADAFVKERPGTAMGIAAGLGFVLGLLSARR